MFFFSQNVLSVHKDRRKNFPRRPVIVPTLFHTVFCDLIDYQKLKTHNSHYTFILVLIDAFSRFAWAKPLKNKEAKTTAAALDDILSSFNHRPAFFASDAGNGSGTF